MHKIETKYDGNNVVMGKLQLALSVLVLVVSIAVSFTTVYEKAETNKQDILEIKQNTSDITEIKLNIKRLCEHFDVDYLDK